MRWATDAPGEGCRAAWNDARAHAGTIGSTPAGDPKRRATVGRGGEGYRAGQGDLREPGKRCGRNPENHTDNQQVKNRM